MQVECFLTTMGSKGECLYKVHHSVCSFPFVSALYKVVKQAYYSHFLFLENMKNNGVA